MLLKRPGLEVLQDVRKRCAFTCKQYSLKGLKPSNTMELLLKGPLTYVKNANRNI